MPIYWYLEGYLTNIYATDIWPLAVYFFMVILLVITMLVLSWLLGQRRREAATNDPFESGIVSVGGSQIRISVEFYLVAIFFVIFDLEALYLYAYAVSIRETGWAGFIAAATFIIDLLIGLVYALSLGALNWSPADKLRKKARLYAAPVGFNLADITRFDGVQELMIDPTGKIPAQSSGQINVSNNIEANRRHLQSIDHINSTGNITSVDFAIAAQHDN